MSTRYRFSAADLRNLTDDVAEEAVRAGGDWFTTDRATHDAADKALIKMARELQDRSPGLDFIVALKRVVERNPSLATLSRAFWTRAGADVVGG